MKTISIFLILFSTMSFADSEPKLALVLKDGTEVTQSEISEVKTSNYFKNRIEWVELKEGTLIDSTDIRSIQTESQLLQGVIILNNDGILDIGDYLIIAAAGDGSGG